MLPLLCQSLPVYDEICARSLKFIYRCVSHDSDLIFSQYCIKYGRGQSCMFCVQRYNCNADNVCCGLINDVIMSFCVTSTESHHAATKCVIRLLTIEKLCNNRLSETVSRPTLSTTNFTNALTILYTAPALRQGILNDES